MGRKETRDHNRRGRNEDAEEGGNDLHYHTVVPPSAARGWVTVMSEMPSESDEDDDDKG